MNYSLRNNLKCKIQSNKLAGEINLICVCLIYTYIHTKYIQCVYVCVHVHVCVSVPVYIQKSDKHV